MDWIVFNYDINKHQIIPFDLFQHTTFVSYLKKAKTESKGDKEAFLEKVKSELRYYFWSKSEYELIIELTDDNRVFLLPWCGSRAPEEEKIEVTDELGIDWLDFAKTHIRKQIFENQAKIDAYDQAIINLDSIVAYLWDSKRLP